MKRETKGCMMRRGYEKGLCCMFIACLLCVICMRGCVRCMRGCERGRVRGCERL